MLKQVYVYVILIVFFSIGFYYNFTSYLNELSSESKSSRSGIDNLIGNPDPYSEISWEGLIQDCGAHVMVENSARANEIFNRKYFKRTVEWKGYFINAFMQPISPIEYNPEHLVNINVRMIPSESLKDADLFLSLGHRNYRKFLPILKTLKTGDAIKFVATLEGVGNEWRNHHLHLLDIKKIDDFIDKKSKVVLFQGVSFNITGHRKIEEKVNQLVNNSTDILNNKNQTSD